MTQLGHLILGGFVAGVSLSVVASLVRRALVSGGR